MKRETWCWFWHEGKIRFYVRVAQGENGRCVSRTICLDKESFDNLPRLELRAEVEGAFLHPATAEEMPDVIGDEITFRTIQRVKFATFKGKEQAFMVLVPRLGRRKFKVYYQ